MSLSNDKYYLPSTLEPRRDEHSTDVIEREPLKSKGKKSLYIYTYILNHDDRLFIN